MSQDSGMLIIGGGVASVSAATELREQGYSGAVTLVTRELHPPYHRPPITKDLLRGDAPVGVVPDDWYAEHDVTLLTRSPVMTLDLEQRVARLANKREVGYDKLLLATGAMVRRLPVEGATLPGVHYLRAPLNAQHVREELDGPRRVVLVGGSFVAVEAAATLRALGHECTMVMLEDRCLATSFGGEVAQHVDDLLRAKGVTIHHGGQVSSFLGDERVTAVATSDGLEVPADVVIVGVGAVPDTKLAHSAGLEIGASRGILCDARLTTSDPHVFSAGDVCEYDSVLHGRHVRIEHERHAEAQGRTAARNMLGHGVEHTELPYFWSDIADWTSLEYVGLAGDIDQEVVTGDRDGDFTVWQLSQGRVVGAVTRGRPEDLEEARAVITEGAELPAQLATELARA
ncbi:hypothetical protein ASG73_00920 [Janibacter sp. Soil728]|uniref:NAD(P)/FAD-dependent oxidoreductase n=1 Tax=Janibacter sp. Soil728 TaxID=1736393 RepID=UPI0006F3E54F|nr:FAD-dependent oxidoreductase [Janibacter sp. Soil728]KRE38962.1 hypothetical protein ASG73_00920 [Janibacter sp. Soil728]